MLTCTIHAKEDLRIETAEMPAVGPGEVLVRLGAGGMGERQCYPVASDVSLGEIAFAESLAVALHAIHRGGDLLGKSALITGQFPLRDAVRAFELAKDKTQSTKVQVVA